MIITNTFSLTDDICAAKFAADGEWYRAKVEKVQGRKANIFYIDYGNREVVEFSELTFLPDQFQSEPGYAHEYKFALIKMPPVSADMFFSNNLPASFILISIQIVLNFRLTISTIASKYTSPMM